MAITALLVSIGRNSLRYLLTQDGGAGTTLAITTTGAATPDILTDSVQGPIRNLAKVIADGYGTFALGAQTQAKARAMWLSDLSGANPGNVAGAGGIPTNPRNNLIATAVCKLTVISGASPSWFVDANVSGGNPTIDIATTAVTASTAYLDVEVQGQIGA